MLLEGLRALHIIDQSRHPAMHETHSIEVICLLQGDVSLILEGSETRIKPGNANGGQRALARIASASVGQGLDMGNCRAMPPRSIFSR